MTEPEQVTAEIIGEDLQIQFTAGTLDANFDALNRYVDGILAQFDGWEPSADSSEDVKACAQAKKYLNALANDLDARRKTVKVQYESPLKAFETRANGVRDKIREVSARLDDVVKQARDAERQAKYDALRVHYEEFAELLAPVVPYERIHKPEWLNKRPTLPQCFDELEERVALLACQLESLKDLNLEFAKEAEVQFFRTLSLSDAIEYNAKLAADRQRIEEMKAQQALYASVPESQGEPAGGAEEPAGERVPTNGQSVPAVTPQVPAEPPVPCVMVIEAATVEQMRLIGGFCGSLVPPVTGIFKRGTLAQIFVREGFR